ncbi:ANTAR domain-containing protein [Sciscionella marina]|uniref:ANTAR domain-containing protein n=1 Tax=Sciscionella marina TaxID=508770 RepID=UPI00036727D2|nr:ANTAR domain-containing protein [Sciscionella marina]
MDSCRRGLGQRCRSPDYPGDSAAKHPSTTSSSRQTERREPAAEALTDVATIGILQQRTIEHGDQLSGQLQTTLHSRIVIGQAKGVLAAHGAVSMDDAFAQLRRYARAHHQRLTDLARSVTDGTADLAVILNHPQR